MAAQLKQDAAKRGVGRAGMEIVVDSLCLQHAFDGAAPLDGGDPGHAYGIVGRDLRITPLRRQDVAHERRDSIQLLLPIRIAAVHEQ